MRRFHLPQRLLWLLFFLGLGVKGRAQLQADFTMDRTGGCSPLAVQFTNISSGTGSNATYKWDLGNGNVSTLRNAAAIYEEEKTYTITLTVTSGNLTSTRSRTITVYKKPVADFSVGAPKVCLPAASQFQSRSTAGDGSITSYHWDFGDGVVQQGYGPQMSYAFTYEQDATVSLTVTNSYGCQSSVTKQNIVQVLPRMVPAFTSNKTLLCSLADSIQLTNTSTGPGTISYAWDFGDGKSATGTNPRHRYDQKGVYNVKLTMSNTDGCTVVSNSLSVNAAYFKTDFTATPLCRQVQFSSSSYLYPNSSWWQLGDGSTAGYSSPSHTYAREGTYTVTLINTYSTCRDTVTKAVQVQEKVNYNSGITMPAGVCRGSNATFTRTSTASPTSTLWNFGDGYSYSTTSPQASHTYTQAGTYDVTITNRFGTCSETVTKSITVNELPDPRGFVEDYGGVCGSPVRVTFKDTTPGAVGWSWAMDWSSSTFSTQQTASYNFSSDGYHTVYLTVRNAAGCSRSTSKYIVIARPSVSISYSQTSSPRGNYDCDSLRLTLRANSNLPIRSYSWDFGDGATSNLPSPQHFYQTVGAYTIKLNYVTESGCSGTATYLARVYPKPKADFSYTVPCGSSLNLLFSDRSFFSDNWVWNFGDGKRGYGANPSNSYADTGKYNVTFINSIGRCSDTVVKVVHANLLPSSVAITSVANTCTGSRGTVTFGQRSVRASGGTWNFGDGVTMAYDSSIRSVQHNYTRSGTYQVTLTSFFGNCVLTSSATVKVLLKQTPVLAANKTEMCSNNTLGLTIKGLEPNPFYGNTSWGQYYIAELQLQDGSTLPVNTYDGTWQYTTYSGTYQNFPAGVHKFRAILRSGNNTCFDTTNFIDLKVNGPRAGFKVLNNGVCFKTPLIFEDTSRSVTTTALTTRQWSFGDGNSQTVSNGGQVTHRYNSPGSYQVRLTVSDASGCSATTSYYVTVRGPKAAFSASGLYVPNVPLNTTVTFYNNTNTFGNNSVQYAWNYGNGSTSAGYTGSQTYTQPGVNTVTLIATDASLPCADTVRQVITVKDFNTAFSFTTSNLGNSSCPPVVVRINNLSVGFTRLLWDFGDGTRSSNQYYPSHIYNKPGTYRITLFTYGYNGLTGTYVDSVVVRSPSAQLSSDLFSGCLSQTVNLKADAANTSTYIWDFADGLVKTVSSGESPMSFTHSYKEAGVYHPRIIVRDAKGCAVSASLAEKIVIDSLVVGIGSLPALICDSALISFSPRIESYSATRLQSTLRYKWDFGTGLPGDTSNVRNPSFRFSFPGTFTAKLTVTSPYGCSKEEKVTIVVNERAKGLITAVKDICQDGSVQFAGTATPSGNVQWSWNFGNGNTAAVQAPPVQTYTRPGTYNVLLVLNRNGCLDTTQHQLMVHPTPLVNALPRETVLCLGNTIQLSASGGGTYAWTPGEGLSGASSATPLASPAKTTVYRVLVTSEKGCVNRDSVKITVAQPVDVALPSELSLCKGSTLQLSASGAATYKWIGTVSGLSSTTIPDPKAAPAVSTTYTVVGYDSYQCFSDTASVRVTLRDLPQVNAGPDVKVSGGGSYQLKPVASSDVTSWAWSPAATLSCAFCPSPVAKPSRPTDYIVTVKNGYGCLASDTVKIDVQCGLSNIYIPDAITPNGDGKNDRFYVMGSGVETVKYLRIFNRWGDLIFERTHFNINDASSAWDGKYKGQLVGTDTYVYVTEMQCASGELFNFKGTVTVVQ